VLVIRNIVDCRLLIIGRHSPGSLDRNLVIAQADAERVRLINQKRNANRATLALRRRGVETTFNA
jgi:hypothetical protein